MTHLHPWISLNDIIIHLENWNFYTSTNDTFGQFNSASSPKVGSHWWRGMALDPHIDPYKYIIRYPHFGNSSQQLLSHHLIRVYIWGSFSPHVRRSSGESLTFELTFMFGHFLTSVDQWQSGLVWYWSSLGIFCFGSYIYWNIDRGFLSMLTNIGYRLDY